MWLASLFLLLEIVGGINQSWSYASQGGRAPYFPNPGTKHGNDTQDEQDDLYQYSVNYPIQGDGSELNSNEQFRGEGISPYDDFNIRQQDDVESQNSYRYHTRWTDPTQDHQLNRFDVHQYQYDDTRMNDDAGMRSKLRNFVASVKNKVQQSISSTQMHETEEYTSNYGYFPSYYQPANEYEMDRHNGRAQSSYESSSYENHSEVGEAHKQFHPNAAFDEKNYQYMDEYREDDVTESSFIGDNYSLQGTNNHPLDDSASSDEDKNNPFIHFKSTAIDNETEGEKFSNYNDRPTADIENSGVNRGDNPHDGVANIYIDTENEFKYLVNDSITATDDPQSNHAFQPKSNVEQSDSSMERDWKELPPKPVQRFNDSGGNSIAVLSNLASQSDIKEKLHSSEIHLSSCKNSVNNNNSMTNEELNKDPRFYSFTQESAKSISEDKETSGKEWADEFFEPSTYDENYYIRMMEDFDRLKSEDEPLESEATAVNDSRRHLSENTQNEYEHITSISGVQQYNNDQTNDIKATHQHSVEDEACRILEQEDELDGKGAKDTQLLNEQYRPDTSTSIEDENDSIQSGKSSTLIVEKPEPLEPIELPASETQNDMWDDDDLQEQLDLYWSQVKASSGSPPPNRLSMYNDRRYRKFDQIHDWSSEGTLMETQQEVELSRHAPQQPINIYGDVHIYTNVSNPRERQNWSREGSNNTDQNYMG